MLFFINHLGKEHRVQVESRGEKLFIKLDDEEETEADLSFFGNDCSFIHRNKVFAANVVGDKIDYTVWRPEGNLQFTVESEYKKLVGILRGQDLEESNHVYAKMPGKIVKISVKPGDTVEKGGAVLVMEAMKMENEIRSSVSGVIKNICVKEGQAVETGSLLVEFMEPEKSE